MSTNTNPIIEIGVLVTSALLITGGVILLYTGKIDFVAATVMFGSALALFGVNTALKAPSPGQQETLRQLVSQLISLMTPPTPARPITSNAYIPPEVRASLGVPARASAVVPSTQATSATQQHTVNAPATPIQVPASGFPVAGTAIANTSIPVQAPTGGNPVYPDAELHFGDTGIIPTVPQQ